MDSFVDDVFEDECHLNPRNFYQNTNTGLNINESQFFNELTPSPSGHPCFKPSTNALRMYVMETEYFKGNQNFDSAGAGCVGKNDDDGWISYKIEEDGSFDEATGHKVKIT